MTTTNQRATRASDHPTEPAPPTGDEITPARMVADRERANQEIERWLTGKTPAPWARA